MNWYRFKIELTAWAAKTALCVLSFIALGRALFRPEDGVRYYPVALRVLAENEWVFPTVYILGVAVLWLCYWKIFRICRGRKAYGAR